LILIAESPYQGIEYRVHLGNGGFSFTLIASVPSYSADSAETSIMTNGWKCSAVELAEADYNGSGYADIRLERYRRGHSYEVKLNADKTEAKGVTGDGTPFTCVKQKKK
jgi:hypothetical protein